MTFFLVFGAINVVVKCAIKLNENKKLPAINGEY